MLLAAAGWLLTAFVVLFLSDDWAGWVFGLGLGASIAVAWPMGALSHRRTIARLDLDGLQPAPDTPLDGDGFP